MTKYTQHVLCWLAGLLAPAQAYAMAPDSYRYLHVTIDTIWNIFLILAPLVLAPFVVLMWMYWRRARARDEQGEDDAPE